MMGQKRLSQRCALASYTGIIHCTLTLPSHTAFMLKGPRAFSRWPSYSGLLTLACSHWLFQTASSHCLLTSPFHIAFLLAGVKSGTADPEAAVSHGGDMRHPWISQSWQRCRHPPLLPPLPPRPSPLPLPSRSCTRMGCMGRF